MEQMQAIVDKEGIEANPVKVAKLMMWQLCYKHTKTNGPTVRGRRFMDEKAARREAHRMDEEYKGRGWTYWLEDVEA